MASRTSSRASSSSCYQFVAFIADWLLLTPNLGLLASTALLVWCSHALPTLSLVAFLLLFHGLPVASTSAPGTPLLARVSPLPASPSRLRLSTSRRALSVLCSSLEQHTVSIDARYGYFAPLLTLPGVNNIILGWAASVVGQTPEKRAVSIAMANTFGNLASVYTPYLWPKSDEPRYMMSMMASIGFSAGVIVCAWVLRIHLQRRNKKMREENPETTNFYVY